MLLVGIFFWLGLSLPTEPTVIDLRINDSIIKAETVSDPLGQYRGLSDRPFLCADCGLLFLFDDEAPREFVMRRMAFSLDIIFINRHQVVSIAANLPPEGEAPQVIYKSDGLADVVLEVNGGYAQEKGIKIGDYVQY